MDILTRQAAFTRLTFARQFLVLSAVILVAGMLILGRWVQLKIEDAVVERTSAVTALYVNSVVGPLLQGVATNDRLDTATRAELDRLVASTPLGSQVVSVKVWSVTGKVLYSSNPLLTDERFPIDDDLAAAANGEVVTRISNLDKPENRYERGTWDELIETYAPVREQATGRIIAVSEFYRIPDALAADIRSARWQTWGVTGAATLAMYLLLVGLVGRASNLIGRQRDELESQVIRLQSALDENVDLQTRMLEAEDRTAALNESFLHQVSADIHDGPAQDVALALLRLDAIGPDAARERLDEDVAMVQIALQSALAEMRGIARGLRLPQVEKLPLQMATRAVIRDFERMTDTVVAAEFESLPATAPLPVRLAIYRIVQEALANAYRHAPGSHPAVHLSAAAGSILLEITDDGAGFDPSTTPTDALGLAGMRERVEILGGEFEVWSKPGRGTRILACVPLDKEVDRG